MKCPRCDSVLSQIRKKGVKIEVCSGCQGEWLHAGELQKIVEHHKEVFTPEETASLDAVSREIFTAEKDDRDELNCPLCKNVQMGHFNYGDTSGIILHKCPKCGGVWTDKDQLEKVEGVVNGWKKCLRQDSKKYGSILKKVELEEQQDLDKAVSISGSSFVNAILRQFCE